MPTLKQKKVAKALLKNASADNALNRTEMLQKVGYSTSMAKARGKDIIESQGVKDALAELGLTEELIVGSLIEDIKLKPQDRLGELRLGAQIRGMTEEKQGNKTVIIMISGQAESRYGTITSPSTDSLG